MKSQPPLRLATFCVEASHALQGVVVDVATANVTDEKYAEMIELLYETGGAIQDIADMLADKKLSAEEIDKLARELHENADGIQLEAVKSAIDRIVAGIGR